MMVVREGKEEGGVCDLMRIDERVCERESGDSFSVFRGAAPQFFDTNP